jgi:hypothetical protein
VGGSGSGGRRDGYAPRLTVEACAVLDMAAVNSVDGIRRGEITTATCEAPGGKFTFRLILDARHAGGESYALDYRATKLRDGEVIETEDVVDRGPLASTRPYFGGLRWWWRCLGCGRRVGKLYLPPGQTRFRCRRCHGLTYRSTRHSHDAEREYLTLIKLGLKLGIIEPERAAVAVYCVRTGALCKRQA